MAIDVLEDAKQTNCLLSPRNSYGHLAGSYKQMFRLNHLKLNLETRLFTKRY